jgi:hypothetical protein
MFDLIGALTSEVGLEPVQAKAMASRFLEYLASLLEEEYGDEAVRRFNENLPHWQLWQDAEPVSPVEPLPSTGGYFGVDERLREIFSGLRIDPVKAGTALPALVRYLKSYLPYEQLSQVLTVAPFLSMAASERPPQGTPSMSGGLNV